MSRAHAEAVAGSPMERARKLSRALEEGGKDAPLHLGRKRWRFTLYFGTWTFVGILFSMPIAISSLAEGTSPPWSMISSEMLRWYLWALLVPVIWWQAQRFPLERRRLVRNLAINLALSVVVTLVYSFLDILKREMVTAIILDKKPSFNLPGDWASFILWSAEYHVLTYFCLLAVIHAFLYYDKFRERELKTTRLEAQLALAHLEVLKTQLHPHFLFNTLNAISALMHRDVDAADRMIALLSDLLRLSLDQDDRHQVPLKDELEFLERYLAIEKIRFRDRLRVEMDIDEECQAAQVPRLILQPLVENSIRHGLAMRSAAGLVAVRARRRGNRLDLTVADDGPGIPEGHGPRREGVGLANTRARLEQIYGDDQTLALEKAEVGGLQVRLDIPFEKTPRIAAGAA